MWAILHCSSLLLSYCRDVYSSRVWVVLTLGFCFYNYFPCASTQLILFFCFLGGVFIISSDSRISLGWSFMPLLVLWLGSFRYCRPFYVFLFYMPLFSLILHFVLLPVCPMYDFPQRNHSWYIILRCIIS